eukprot:Hpha_TRINITY_DN13941_c0_g1::TRINITY_DN13941_c0_g1_i1::g.35326::m.35326
MGCGAGKESGVDAFHDVGKGNKARADCARSDQEGVRDGSTSYETDTDESSEAYGIFEECADDWMAIANAEGVTNTHMSPLTTRTLPQDLPSTSPFVGRELLACAMADSAARQLLTVYWRRLLRQRKGSRAPPCTPMKNVKDVTEWSSSVRSLDELYTLGISESSRFQKAPSNTMTISESRSIDTSPHFKVPVATLLPL